MPKAEATAAALACRCRDFDDQVLDTLWETQGQMSALLALESLPVDVWKADRCRVSTPKTCVPSSLNCLVSKASDDTRMDSLPEVRSQNAKDGRVFVQPVFERFVGSATP